MRLLVTLLCREYHDSAGDDNVAVIVVQVAGFPLPVMVTLRDIQKNERLW
jgi:hypothetical protein